MVTASGFARFSDGVKPSIMIDNIAGSFIPTMFKVILPENDLIENLINTLKVEESKF